MRIRLTDSPRQVATIAPSKRVIMRVITGRALLSNTNQDLLDGGGIPITDSDGILSTEWDASGGEIWMLGTPAAEVEVILP